MLKTIGYQISEWLIEVNNVFASYQMPILMLASGPLLAKSLNKSLPVYFLGKP